jgi:hypothetical protein
MGYRVSGVGYQLLQMCEGPINRLDTVVDIEDLPFTQDFASDRS